MKPLFPKKLCPGDGVRVIAPATSLAAPWITEEVKIRAHKRFEQMSLKLSFSQYVSEIDDFNSSSIDQRVSDLHEAFEDESIHMIISCMGGFNSNQLLRYIDYELIKNNPKILCGYSDITALTNAIYTKTGLVTYSGPHFFSFGEKKGFDYSFEFFKKCFMQNDPFQVLASEKWSNDLWSYDQENRNFFDNEGHWIINTGKTEGNIVGGNQCTLNLLQGTEYMPDLTGSLLFLEDDYEAHAATIDRDLQSLIHLPAFQQVKGIIFGRFQPQSKMTKDLFQQIIRSKKELNDIPVIANVDFGHTTPMITFPIGGYASLKVEPDKAEIRIIKH